MANTSCILENREIASLMKIRNWKRIAAMTAAFGLAFGAGAYAQDIVQRVDAYLRPDFQIVVDGKPLNLAHSTIIYDDSSYLPLKELGTALGANVSWRGDTKTIYVNSRINPEQQETGAELKYDMITMENPMCSYVDYLGGTYVLVKLISPHSAYYRESDLKAMGIDTNGLKKVQEKYTKWLFVSEEEVKKRWKQEPAQNYTMITDYNTVPTTETDPKKLQELKDFAKSWSSYQLDGKWRYTTFIVADKMPEENSYRLLGAENGHYYFYNLKLSKYIAYNNTDYTYIRNSSKEDIQAGYPDPDPYAAYR